MKAALTKTATLTLTLLVFSSGFAAAQSRAPFGPIAVRNHHPVYIGLLYPPPEGGAAVEKLAYEAAVNHTNIFLVGQKGLWAADMDKEVAELSLTARYPLNPGKLEIGLDAPLYRSGPGFMDGFVRFYHSSLGFPGYSGQEDREDYRYSDALYHKGEKIVQGEEGAVEPGDATMWIKGTVKSGSKLDLSLQSLVQAPTGDADRGTGNGRWEFGIRILGTSYGENSALHFGMGVMSPGGASRSSGEMSYSPLAAAFFSGEYFKSRRLSLYFQSMFNSSPLPGSHMKQISQPWIEFTLGIKYILESGHTLAFGLSENLNRTAPDFTIHFSIGK